MATLSEIVINNVRAERGRRGWTQEDLAERMGLHNFNVSNIETGRRAVLADHLPRLCRAFEIPLEQLVFGADPSDLEALGL